jgi:hypothetical protein
MFDKIVLLLRSGDCWTRRATKAVRRVRAGEERGYSAAATTTATTRDAAQVDCAALGERKLEAG